MTREEWEAIRWRDREAPADTNLLSPPARDRRALLALVRELLPLVEAGRDYAHGYYSEFEGRERREESQAAALRHIAACDARRQVREELRRAGAKAMIDHAAELRRVAVEIRSEGINGWGNSCADAAAYMDALRAALESIAKNSCCGSCQEAALVARAALERKP